MEKKMQKTERMKKKLKTDKVLRRRRELKGKCFLRALLNSAADPAT